MTIERLDLVDFLFIAEAVLGRPAEQLAWAVHAARAESALAAPFASFAGIDFYDDPAERAAICCSRVIRNHPLPNGNRRMGYECMREMLLRSRTPWPRPREDAAEIAGAIEDLTSRVISEQDFVRWVKHRTKIRER
jgi:death-on-curing protein